MYLPELKSLTNAEMSSTSISKSTYHLLNRAQIISYHVKDPGRQLILNFPVFEKIILDLLEIKYN
jgi:hypothetical protein